MLRRTILTIIIGLYLAAPASAAAVSEDDTEISNDLAAILRAGREVVSANQDRINDPERLGGWLSRKG